MLVLREGGAAEQLVDAYAHLKKVNDEGRALMQRDVKVLQAALDNLLRRNLLPPFKTPCRMAFKRWCGVPETNWLDERVSSRKSPTAEAPVSLKQSKGRGAW